MKKRPKILKATLTPLILPLHVGLPTSVHFSISILHILDMGPHECFVVIYSISHFFGEFSPLERICGLPTNYVLMEPTL